MRMVICLLWGAAALLAADQSAPSGYAASSESRLWKFSLASVAVANTLDVQSSWGKHELNGTLAGAGGTFGSHGAGIKIGLQTGLVAAECFFVRHDRSGKAHRAAAWINFAVSAVVTGVAAHNYTVRGMR